MELARVQSSVLGPVLRRWIRAEHATTHTSATQVGRTRPSATRVRTSGFIDYYQMQASTLETYPYPPRLSGQHRVSPHSSRRFLVVFELRHLPANEPAALPPSSRARCRFRRHPRRYCCLQGVQHRRLRIHALPRAASSSNAPIPGRGLVRAGHPANPPSGAGAHAAHRNASASFSLLSD
jgi:hypothetical protein